LARKKVARMAQKELDRPRAGYVSILASSAGLWGMVSSGSDNCPNKRQGIQ
jgi:hypothetical protein